MLLIINQEHFYLREQQVKVCTYARPWHLLQLPYSFLYHRSDDHGDDHFYQVGRDEWDYADCESSFESVICNQAEPYSSEEVAYDRSDDHTDKLDPWLMAVINCRTAVGLTR